MELTEYDALQAYARMMNTLNPQPFEEILADDFVYESQHVLQPMKSKNEFMNYIVPKLQTVARANATVFAEMGNVSVCGSNRPCVILAQHDKSNLVILVLAEVEGNKLKRIDLCIVPPPQSAERSGEYPH